VDLLAGSILYIKVVPSSHCCPNFTVALMLIITNLP
jgi:hypothetical protein